MITDYSEVTATMPRRVADLTRELNDRNWKQAHVLCLHLACDLLKVAGLIVFKVK